MIRMIVGRRLRLPGRQTQLKCVLLRLDISVWSDAFMRLEYGQMPTSEEEESGPESCHCLSWRVALSGFGSFSERTSRQERVVGTLSHPLKPIVMLKGLRWHSIRTMTEELVMRACGIRHGDSKYDSC